MESTLGQCSRDRAQDFVSPLFFGRKRRRHTLGFDRVSGVFIFCGMFLLTTGCQLIVDPYHDEMADLPPVTTASTVGLREANITPRTIHPLGEAKTVQPKTGTIIHGPLYFEDPYDESGSEDGQFAITNEDVFAFVATGIRFIVNADFYPVSFFVTPPWMPMASDGHPSRDRCCTAYDATPLTKPAD